MILKDTFESRIRIIIYQNFYSRHRVPVFDKPFKYQELNAIRSFNRLRNLRLNDTMKITTLFRHE